jgi:hypothetical protein
MGYVRIGGWRGSGVGVMIDDVFFTGIGGSIWTFWRWRYRALGIGGFSIALLGVFGT